MVLKIGGAGVLTRGVNAVVETCSRATPPPSPRLLAALPAPVCRSKALPDYCDSERPRRRKRPSFEAPREDARGTSEFVNLSEFWSFQLR